MPRRYRELSSRIPLADFKVALQPAEYIARKYELVEKLGYAVLAGPGNSLDDIAADTAFSLLPVIGVYSDIRDTATELFKFASGSEDFDKIALGFAIVGIITEFTPADVATDFAKGFYKSAKAGLIKTNGVIFNETFKKIKDLGGDLATFGSGAPQKLNDFWNFLDETLLAPILGGHAPDVAFSDSVKVNLSSFVDDAISNKDEFEAMQTLTKNIIDFP